MAVSVRIKQKSLFKKKLRIDDVIKISNLNYGVYDEYYRLKPNEFSKNTFLYDKKSLGRGFEIWLENNDICLSLNLPCSKNDIIIFYQTIEKLCTKLKISDYSRNDEIIKVKDTDELIENEIRTVENVLANEKEKIDNKSKEFLTIFGIYNPISLGKKEFKEIDNNIDKFSDLLNEKQSIDAYFAAPHFFKNNETNKNFGMYAITEDVLSIVPIEPYVPFNHNIKTDDWRVCLINKEMNDNMQEQLENEFMNNQEERNNANYEINEEFSNNWYELF